MTYYTAIPKPETMLRDLSPYEQIVLRDTDLDLSLSEREDYRPGEWTFLQRRVLTLRRGDPSLSWDQIGTRLGLTVRQVRDIISREQVRLGRERTRLTTLGDRE